MGSEVSGQLRRLHHKNKSEEKSIRYHLYSSGYCSC